MFRGGTAALIPTQFFAPSCAKTLNCATLDENTRDIVKFFRTRGSKIES